MATRRQSFTGPSRTINENTQVGISILNTIRPIRRSRSMRLEEVIDIDNDLEIYRNNEINLLNPRTLYSV